MTPITDKLAEAHRLGATGAEPTEEERLLFEAWMRGHCWALCATWNGKQYVSDAEQGGLVDPRAMNTRQLFAAWRDRAALAAYASQQAEPSDARVEAAAMALARMSYGPLALASDAAEWREHARAVLQAADAVRGGRVPHVASELASKEIDAELERRGFPSNPKNAARAGYLACVTLAGLNMSQAPGLPAPPPQAQTTGEASP